MRLIALVLAVLFALPANADDALYFTPYDDPLPVILKTIDSAQSEVLVGAYGFNDAQITQALCKATARGVKVSMVVDKSQSGLPHQKMMLSVLDTSKVYIHIGRSASNGIMHAKFMVIDNKVEIDGSFNFTESALKQDNTITISDNKTRVDAFERYWHHIDEDMQTMTEIKQN